MVAEPNRPEGQRATPWQRPARWFLTGVTCVLFVIFSEWGRMPQPAADDDDDSERIRIEGMRPLELSPGGTIAISMSGAELDGPPVWVSIDKQPVTVLKRAAGTIVVRVPDDLEEGRANVRLHQGDERSKKRDVWLRPLDLPKVVQMGILGIALVVLGLRTLARGIRTYAGQRLRVAFERLSAGTWHSMALGTLLGGATQSTTASAGVLVGLLSSNLVSRTMALAVIFGAQLGAAATALVLPLGTQAAVLLVALGVIWVSLSDNRHGRALAKVLLGLGLLFFGFQTTRVGFQPLVAGPDALEAWSDGSTPLNAVSSALVGALMTALLQGPGPTFVVVLGLVESTDATAMHHGLRVLAGIPLGVGVVSAVVAWPFGGAPRRWAATHLALGALATLLLMVSTPMWAALADLLIPGDPRAVGVHQVLLPAAAPHLVAAFLSSQAAVAALMVFSLRYLHRFKRLSPASAPAPSEAALSDTELRFGTSIAHMQRALDHVYAIWSEGDRSNAEGAEGALLRTQQELEALLQTSRGSTDPAAGALFSASIALLKARDDLAAMQRLAEDGLEQGITPGPRETEALRRLHDLAHDGFATLAVSAKNANSGEIDAAREREIWLNAEDARVRSALQSRRTDLTLAYLQHWCAVSAAYEQLGNQLFRAADALLSDADDD